MDEFDERYDGCSQNNRDASSDISWSTLISRSVTALLVVLLLLWLSQSAGANPYVLKRGLVCDEQEGIKTFIQTRIPGKGCGLIAGTVVAVVTVVETYTFKGVSYRIAKYEIISKWRDKKTQFGIFGRPVKVVQYDA